MNKKIAKALSYSDTDSNLNTILIIITNVCIIMHTTSDWNQRLTKHILLTYIITRKEKKTKMKGHIITTDNKKQEAICPITGRGPDTYLNIWTAPNSVCIRTRS